MVVSVRFTKEEYQIFTEMYECSNEISPARFIKNKLLGKKVVSYIKETNKKPVSKRSIQKDLVVCDKVLFKINESTAINISNDLINAWLDTYPHDFFMEEMKKARNWVLCNPHKAPKSNWGRFINSWLTRGWEIYRKGLKSNPPKMSFEELQDALRGSK